MIDSLTNESSREKSEDSSINGLWTRLILGVLGAACLSAIGSLRQREDLSEVLTQGRYHVDSDKKGIHLKQKSEICLVTLKKANIELSIGGSSTRAAKKE
ncbi:hypothetical protein [Salarchaeum sp. JOR-1]|uniref:hypothetical protein n=1 Tax=Salarchaeum sp. JOR-1 TaxID=2599399 RepID=UPI001198A3DC|nr:hypothetical protein [Salarchaeum sp. JOR-1]QDX39477.1 hypothetical protein FQU85_00760 [Salarchaeum sp. JOR-1]